MATMSGFKQASVSATLLRGVIVAVALTASASPALAAGPVTLSCKIEGSTDAITLRIDYSTGLVEQIGPSGKPYTNRIASNASITANAIVWSAELMDTGLEKPVPMKWEGTLDRLSGTGSTRFSRSPDWYPYSTNITCSQASQKF